MAASTYLMCYPPTRWQIRGGANFRSQERAAANPRAAFAEWMRLADAITRAGGRILVMTPPDVDPPLTGLVYTANTGALFRRGDQSVWLLAKMTASHRAAENEQVRAFWAEANVPVELAPAPWEGQADLTALPANRFILTYGVRSAKESLAPVRALLPSNARVLEIQLREPWFHGDTCLSAISTRAGDTTLLVHEPALVDSSAAELRRFVGDRIDVIPVDADDAKNYVCNALAVDGTLIVPAGVSTSLQGLLLRRGFALDEIELPELFGKGGGGPRCLVNELRGFVLTPAAPDYVSRRDQLQLLLERYPESAA